MPPLSEEMRYDTSALQLTPSAWKRSSSSTWCFSSFNKGNNTPLCQLFVSMLQRLGIEVDSFASGSKRLPGLELS